MDEGDNEETPAQPQYTLKRITPEEVEEDKAEIPHLADSSDYDSFEANKAEALTTPYGRRLERLTMFPK